jgi:tetratricopeptide (TPR) repeat protein
MQPTARIGRNDPCFCGSGRKYKHCCLRHEDSQPAGRRPAAASTANAVRLAQEHHQAGRLQHAEAMCWQALEADPAQPDALHLLGLLAYRADRNDVAAAFINKAIQAEPSEPSYHSNLGLVYQALARLDEAVDSYRRAITIRPDDFVAHNNLGTALLAADQPDEAIACHRRALAIRPDHVEAHYNLGAALRDWGKPEEAANSLRAALALQPDFAEAHNSLGAALQESGRLDEAIACIRTALRLKPDYAEAHFNLHSLLLEPGNVAPAIECLMRAVELRPEETAFRFFLGMLLEYRGDVVAAAAHFDRVARASSLDRARLDAWRYIRSAGEPLPPVTGSLVQAFRIGLDAAVGEGLVLEFGVRFGVSIRQVAALARQHVHGFDSFQGLPKNWHHEPRGSYTTGGALPAVPANVILHAGWFEETLPRFLEQHAGPVRFMNVDCDLYSSTVTVLELLANRIVPGTVIVFDEYIGYEHWRDDEFRAFQEAVARHGWRYEYLCFSFATKQVAVRILREPRVRSAPRPPATSSSSTRR